MGWLWYEFVYWFDCVGLFKLFLPFNCFSCLNDSTIYSMTRLGMLHQLVFITFNYGMTLEPVLLVRLVAVCLLIRLRWVIQGLATVFNDVELFFFHCRAASFNHIWPFNGFRAALARPFHNGFNYWFPCVWLFRQFEREWPELLNMTQVDVIKLTSLAAMDSI